MKETKPLRISAKQPKKEIIAEFNELQLLLAIKIFERERKEKLSKEQQK